VSMEYGCVLWILVILFLLSIMICSSPACSRKNKTFATKNKGNKTKYSQYKQNEVHADYINVHLRWCKTF
jgi:hypothetical protein